MESIDFANTKALRRKFITVPLQNYGEYVLNALENFLGGSEYVEFSIQAFKMFRSELGNTVYTLRSEIATAMMYKKRMCRVQLIPHEQWDSEAPPSEAQ